MKDKIFVPTTEEKYREIKLPAESGGSINDIGNFLGYSPDQHYTYLGILAGFPDLTCIIFKKFSKSIIAVIVSDKVDVLTQKDVDKFLSKFDYNTEYSTFSRESDLDEAIINKSFSKDFFCDVLNMPFESVKGEDSIHDLLNGYVYFFENDILVGYQPIENCSGWVKEFKERHPHFFEALKEYAESYWGNNEEKVHYEIEGQINSFVNIPKGMENELLREFHLSGNLVYNFRIVDTILSQKPISLYDFLLFTHNEARLINTRESIIGKIYTYIYKNRFFQFSEEGNFIKCFTDL